MDEYTIKQVAEHNSPEDAWLIIHGQVYDVTKYLADHPGGADALTEAAGTDASEDFDNAGHSEDAFEIMKDCCVGKVQGFEKKKPKLKPLVPVKSVKAKTGGSSSVSTLASLGFIVCAGAGAYYFGRRQGLTVPDWLLASLRSDSAGSSFIKGIIVGGGSFVTANAIAAQRFTTMVMKSKPFTSYPAHMKIPKRAQEDTLLQRGLLDPVTYSPLPLKQKTLIAPNVYRLTFSLPTTSTILGLPIGQHVTIKADVDGESVARSYTPVSNNSDLGVLELVIKAYPDGKLTSKYLATLEVGDEVLFRGPKGAMKYQPNFCKKIGMIAGGTGITPMFQVIRAICEHDRDTTEISLIYANRTEQDILLREELDRFARRYPKNLKMYYMLDQPPENWKFGSGALETWSEPNLSQIQKPVAVARLPIIIKGYASAGHVLVGSSDGKPIKTLVSDQRMPDGIDISKSAGKLFWTCMGNPSANDGAILSCNLDGTGLTEIVPQGSVHTPKQLTVDNKNSKLYFADREGMRIMRCNFDGSELQVLVQTGDWEVDSQMLDPTRWCVGVAVSPSAGKFYWTQKGPSKGGKGRILQANIDFQPGEDAESRTDIEVLFLGLPEPIDLEVDESENVLYWTDRGELPFGNTINRAKVGDIAQVTHDGASNPGKDYEVVARGLHEAIGIKLDLKNRRIFATDLGGLVYQFDVDGGNRKKVYEGSGAFAGITVA
ncbi:hypothetical protein FGADI_9146 [Fusarium gaditjirri]|uniref:Cytochrome-b5 reductase n=1 Tax=Fusarium gaditjirri TaxID=282569 RepID=A0A8H4T0F6_9HYPO|nr:hypothetical protein FGADI_9146 [Fusarium gaditjirri]